jgi:hypothetical protein
MVVAIAKRVRTNAGVAHRAVNRRQRPWTSEHDVNRSPRLVPAASWWPRAERATPWDRIKDDRECIPLKTLLLTSLLLLAAVLEWVA